MAPTTTRTPARYSLARALKVAYDMDATYNTIQFAMDEAANTPLFDLDAHLAALDTTVSTEPLAWGTAPEGTPQAAAEVALLEAAMLAGERAATTVEPSTYTPDANAWYFPEDATDAPTEVTPVAATPTASIMATLDSALSAIQTTHPDIPAALAVVISTGRGKIHGHFEAGSWGDTGGEHAGSARHEILISSESLGLGAQQVLTTLIHECAHAYAFGKDIKDTSRQGRFHNRKFETIASGMGLITEEDSSIGHRTPGLNTWALSHYADTLTALEAVLITHRTPRAKAKAPKTTVKVSCACEGSAVTVPIKWADTYAPAMVCTDCDETLAPVE